MLLILRGDEELDSLVRGTISGGGVSLYEFCFHLKSKLYLVIDIYKAMCRSDEKYSNVSTQVIPHIHKSLLPPKGQSTLLPNYH